LTVSPTAPRILRRPRMSQRMFAAAAVADDLPTLLADEPVLAMDEIQGNVIPGFSTSHLELMGLRIGDGQSTAARQWLRELTPLITTAAHAWRAKANNSATNR